MNGTIVNFRRSLKRTYHTQMIVEVDKVNNREEAKKLVGKTVVWKSPANKEIKGKVASAHGNKGAVRVIFETGMPGQAIGTKVSIN